LSELDGGAAGELRVYIQQEAIVFYPACNMQLANIGKLQLVQETGDIETMVVRIALEIVDIQDQAATGSIDERIEKPGF
jgi:hypothetical protein